LVHALTGVDPDRLKEEKRRGITIELGFADLELDAERVISFVDVPGHERFVRHMVAGATGIEAVMLVVAADQGVQPQTREHLEICGLLGIERGVIALSKSDLVDDDLLEVVALEVRELVEGTFLHGAAALPVSSRDGRGMDALRAELAGLCDVPEPASGEGIARLPVDRSFSLRGFGTVVTGTLLSGALHQGEEVEVSPRGPCARIRGLQVHHKQVETARAGRRTAVNLQGLDCEEVPRGATLIAAGSLRPTRRLWARAQLLPHAPRALLRGGPVRFHQGTCDRAARLRVLRGHDDGRLDVEIFLEDDAALVPGDRFVLRRPAPVDTVGGGTVVDVNPPHPRAADAESFEPDSIESGRALALRLRRAGAAGLEPDAVAAELGLTRAQLESRLAGSPAESAPVVAGSRWIDPVAWRATEDEAIEQLARFHEAEPLRLGMEREALRAATSRTMQQESWRKMLESLARRGALRLRGDSVALADHDVSLDGEERRLSDRIDAAFLEAGLDPPDLDAVVEAGERAAAGKLLQLLIARGRIVRIQDGKLFHAEALDDLRARLREFAQRSKTMGVAEFKDLAGVTRKNAIPLLEHLDAERTTRRVGNQREILLS